MIYFLKIFSCQFCWRSDYTLNTVRDNNLVNRQDIRNVGSNIDKVIVQKEDSNHKQFGNKEQIKTMISITSCNPVAINHQVHRRASWRSQILAGSGREKKIHVLSLFTNVYFINLF